MSGKLRGNLYKVFICPDGNKYYSLAKAIQGGYQADGCEDGRKKKKRPLAKLKKVKVRASDSISITLYNMSIYLNHAVFQWALTQ